MRGLTPRSAARAPRDDRRVRIAMFINDLGRGGAETQFLRVARALRGAGHEICIFTILDTNDFGDELGDLPVHLLSARPGVATVTNAIRELRAWRPDAVLSFLYQATLIGRFAARAARVPVVISSMRNERLESRLRSTLYRVTGVVDSSTVTNSRRAAAMLEAGGTVRRGRLRVIPNGVDLHRFERADRASVRAELGLREDVFLFVGIGRLAPQKDWPNLIAAIGRYTGPQACWAVAGDGPEHGALSARILASGLSDRVRLLGLRADVADLLAACDGLVLSSAYEGLPNVVLEAMAAGRPVVATDVGGCRELVAPEFGALVAPGDPDALAAAMTALAGRSADERARMGAAARHHVHAHYALESADRQWAELVDALLERAGVVSRGGAES